MSESCDMRKPSAPTTTIDDIARERRLRSIVDCNRVSFLVTLVEIETQPFFEIWLQGASTGKHQLTISAHRATDVGTTLSFSTSMSCEDDVLTCTRIAVNPHADIPFRPFRMTVQAESHTENGGKRTRPQNGRKYRNVNAAPRNGMQSAGGALRDSFLGSFCFSWIGLFQRFDNIKHAIDGGFSIEVTPP